MKNFDTRVYSIGDFLEWDTNDLLELSPDFQRRGVWTKQAKSYLMDTVVSGKPMPKILMSQKLQGRRSKRIIIDGQQRLRAVLEFCRDEYSISKTHSREYGGVRFSDLPVEVQNEILTYEMGVDVLFDLSYEETLDIFARLNTYSVRLNKQEMLNAKYLGPFKQTAYRIGYKFVTYWIDAGILTKAKVSRMGEAELASDLLVVAVDGIQGNKSIEKYYRGYEDEQSDLSKEAERAQQTLELILNIYPSQDIKNTNFRRIHVFYSLYCALYHSLYGVPSLDAPKVKRIGAKAGKARVILDDFSALYSDEHWTMDEFIDASRRGTTDPGRRRYRAKYICEYLATHIEKNG